MQKTTFIAAALILVLACILVASSNFHQDYLYHPATGADRNTEFNLQDRTTERRINRFDPRTRTVQNIGKGLFSIGPSTYLQKGRYQLFVDFTPLKVDKKRGEMAYDIYIINRDRTTTILKRRTVDIRRFHKNPWIEFDTPGGVGHEFALYVSSPETRLALRSIRIKPVSLGYGPHILYTVLAAAFLVLAVFLLKKGLVRKIPVESELYRALLLAGGVFVVYVLTIIQPFWPIKAISLTGDAPHFVVLAHYIAKYKTLTIESLDKVYDYATYGPLIGFKIFDPPTHMHAVGQYIYPHHQFGYAAVLSLIFMAGFSSVVPLMVFSALCISVGVAYTYKLLLHTPNKDNAFLLAAVAGLSPPLFFYSFALFTEVLAFPVIAAAAYYLIFDRKSQWKQYLSVALMGALLFFKVKYTLICVPLLVCGLVGNGTRRTKIAKVALFVAMAVLYEVHVRTSTGSFHPFAWYRSVTSGQAAGLSIRAMFFPVMSVGFLVDQRYGMFLRVPFTILILFSIGQYYRTVREQRGPTLLVLIVTAVYMGLYASSGSYGGTCPALRPHLAAWALIVFLVFAVKIDLSRIWPRVLIGLSVLFTVLMLGTGYFMTNYTENYAKFYETLTPYRFKLYKYLPNTTLVHTRILKSIPRPKAAALRPAKPASVRPGKTSTTPPAKTASPRLPKPAAPLEPAPLRPTGRPSGPDHGPPR